MVNSYSSLPTGRVDMAGSISGMRQFYRMEQQEFDVFAKNARDHVEQNYDISKNALVLEDIYHQALKNRK